MQYLALELKYSFALLRHPTVKFVINNWTGMCQFELTVYLCIYILLSLLLFYAKFPVGSCWEGLTE